MSKYGNDILFAAVVQPKKLLGKPRHPPSLQTFPSFAQCPAAWRDPPSAKHAAGSKGPHSHGSLSQTGGFLARRPKKGLSSTPLWQQPEGQQAYAALLKKSRAHSTKVNRGSPATSQPAYSCWSLVCEHWLFLCWFPGLLGKRKRDFPALQSHKLTEASAAFTALGRPSQVLGSAPAQPKSHTIPKPSCSPRIRFTRMTDNYQ